MRSDRVTKIQARWDELDLTRKTLAWLVHLYTVSGGILGMAALFSAAFGETRLAFFLLIASMVIDSTDGILARAANVTEVLPNFSGAQVDDAVDVLTFIFVPIFIIGYQQLLPHPLWLVVPIVAGLYAYGQVDMKTEDNFFRGFPSYWNIIALYMYWLRPEGIWAVLMVVIPAILTFIPTRYLYPSRNSLYWKTSWFLGGTWLIFIVVLLWNDPPEPLYVWLSTYFPFYYLIMSFYVDWKLRRKSRREEAQHTTGAG
jgi:phosphatidylcholine synthase